MGCCDDLFLIGIPDKKYLGLEILTDHCSSASGKAPGADESAALQDSFSVASLAQNLDDRRGNQKCSGGGTLGRWCGAAGRSRHTPRFCWCPASRGRSCTRDLDTVQCLGAFWKGMERMYITINRCLDLMQQKPSKSPPREADRVALMTLLHRTKICSKNLWWLIFQMLFSK